MVLHGVGETFTTLSIDGHAGWKFTLTDVMRDATAQKKRKSLKGNTHTTARSFDVSDGRWTTPEGASVTWSAFNAEGKPTGRSPYAVTIDSSLRPAFERTALDAGWILFKEPGHWHIYVPKETRVDLKDEWKAYVETVAKREGKAPESVERPSSGEGMPSVSSEIARELLKDATGLASQRRTFEELSEDKADLQARLLQFYLTQTTRTVTRPFLSALMEFPSDTEGDAEDMPTDPLQAKGWLKKRILALVRSSSPEDLARLQLLEGTTVHGSGRPSFAELQNSWKWKRAHRIFPKYEGVADIISNSIGALDHTMALPNWYAEQTHVYEGLLACGDAFGFPPELVRYTTPEVMLATIHAEFFSEFDGETFLALAPVIFEAYNIVFAPAANDRELSCGPVQLTEKTFLGSGGMASRYGKGLEDAKKRKIFKDVVLPKKGAGGAYPDKEVADAMALHTESVVFWSSISLLHHMDSGFSKLIANEDFKEKWERASDEDRLRFVAAFAPLANNGGVGRAKQAAGEILRIQGEKDLGNLAQDLQISTRHATAVRGAKKGLETMNTLIRRAKP